MLNGEKGIWNKGLNQAINQLDAEKNSIKSTKRKSDIWYGVGLLSLLGGSGSSVAVAYEHMGTGDEKALFTCFGLWAIGLIGGIFSGVKSYNLKNKAEDMEMDLEINSAMKALGASLQDLISNLEDKGWLDNPNPDFPPDISK